MMKNGGRMEFSPSLVETQAFKSQKSRPKQLEIEKSRRKTERLGEELGTTAMATTTVHLW